ncbi:acetyl-CoA hydrolase/transferase family protein [Sphingosinicella sp. LY1275]|uniref:acetyl-CoA hydrolase/transferase family protein n=1 Tax=Sphingosinicella sp. LY1275 TaxID=3095379 RepID=UPI002ADEEDF5|nr:acetyl-CoA hydrolase/transferase C-terminal domain-containing protein [Sphingosinicella sp. LY1275]MEA1015362.1 acetyl-CoA hydrolase/transferase C-terminal domain-containing protein [Sphingosinicella sp. LY1275]
MMRHVTSVDALDFAALIRPGEHVLFGEGAAEPVTIAEAFVAARARLGRPTVFLGMTLAGTFRAEHADHLAFRSYGALGMTRRLADAGVLDILPIGLGQIPALLARGALRFDVVIIAVPPAGADGRHALGLTALYQLDAIRSARLVIAEVNHALPTIPGASIDPADIHVLVETHRAPPELAPPNIGSAARETARLAAGFIEDGATLQLGVGAIPEALCAELAEHRGLGIHSGLLGSGLGRLIAQGVVDREAVVGAVMGDASLYRFVDGNQAIRLAGIETTHGQAGSVANLVAVNGALEVDLSGQVNGEVAGGRYVGAVGGQAEFARAAARAPKGRSIFVLNATTRGESASSITASPVARVTTTRADVDVVVTEFGAAELTGCGEAERRRRLIAIAHPRFRDTLEEQSHG